MSDAVKKAKSWELGTVRQDPKTKEIRLVLNKGVEVFVHGRQVVIDPTYRTLKALSENEMVKKDEAFIAKGFRKEGDLEKNAQLRKSKNIKGTLVGSFEEQN